MLTRFQLDRIALLVVFLAMPTAMRAQGNVGCVSATNPGAPIYRDGYGGMVSRTDQASATNRAVLGLPNIPNAQVTIVSDTTTCRIASVAYDSVFSVPTPNEPPLVLRLGTQYVVIKGIDIPQHGRANVLFNQDFTIAQKTIWY